MRANLAQAGLTRMVQMRTGGARAWKNKCGSDEIRAALKSGSHACVKTKGRTSDAAVGTTELAVRLSATQIAQMSGVPWCRLAGVPGFGAAAASAAAACGIAMSLRWIWPNERMSCSASASRPSHAPTRRLPRTHIIATAPFPPGTYYNGTARASWEERSRLSFRGLGLYRKGWMTKRLSGTRGPLPGWRQKGRCDIAAGGI